MTTSFIGLKELRQNLTRVANTAQKGKRRYIVMRKNKPLFELRPLSEEEAAREAFASAIAEAEADIRAGRLYTQEQVEKMLGI